MNTNKNAKRNVVYADGALKTVWDASRSPDDIKEEKLSQLQLVEHVRTIKQSAVDRNKGIDREENNNLRPNQKTILANLEEHLDTTAAGLVSFCATADIDSPHFEEQLLQCFESYRYVANYSEPRSGKSLATAIMCFNSLYAKWLHLLKKLPSKARAILMTMPRQAYITTEVAHKKEIMKEGLDNAEFGTLAIAKKKADTCMVMRDDGLAILPQHVAKMAKHTYNLDKSGFSKPEFREAWQVVSTVQRAAKEIKKRNMGIGAFFTLSFEEWHLHQSPATLPRKDKEDWALVLHTMRTSFIVGITGTPSELMEKGWTSPYDPDKTIVPKVISRCTYGDLYLAGFVCRVNFVSLKIEKVVVLNNGNHLALDGVLSPSQKAMVRYSPDIWCLVAGFNLNFIIGQMKAKGFLQQGITFTPAGRPVEEGSEDVPDSEVEHDKNLPKKMCEAVQKKVLDENPDDYQHPIRGGQLRVDYVMSGEPSVNKLKIDQFVDEKVIDMVFSQNIMRTGINNETCIMTCEFPEHKNAGIQKQGDRRAATSILEGSKATREACRKAGCLDKFEAYVADRTRLKDADPLGRWPKEDCWNVHLAINEKNLDNARSSLKGVPEAFKEVVRSVEPSPTFPIQLADFESEEGSSSDQSNGMSGLFGPPLQLQTPVRAPRAQPLSAQQQQDAAEKARRKAAADAKRASEQLLHETEKAEQELKAAQLKLDRQRRALERGRDTVDKFVSAPTNIEPTLGLDAKPMLKVTHMHPLQSDETISYKLWSTERGIPPDGSGVDDEHFSVVPAECHVSSGSVVFSASYDPNITAFKVSADVGDSSPPVRFFGGQHAVPGDTASKVEHMLQEAARKPLPPWKPSKLSTSKLEAAQKQLDADIVDNDAKQVTQVFIHAVCSTDDRDMKRLASALCDEECLGPQFANLVNDTRAQMGASSELRDKFVGSGALAALHQAEAESVLAWPLVPSAKQMAEARPDDSELYTQGPDGAWPVSCTVESILFSCGAEKVSILNQLLSDYKDRIAEQSCASDPDDEPCLMDITDEEPAHITDAVPVDDGWVGLGCGGSIQEEPSDSQQVSNTLATQETARSDREPPPPWHGSGGAGLGRLVRPPVPKEPLPESEKGSDRGSESDGLSDTDMGGQTDDESYSQADDLSDDDDDDGSDDGSDDDDDYVEPSPKHTSTGSAGASGGSRPTRGTVRTRDEFEAEDSVDAPPPEVPEREEEGAVVQPTGEVQKQPRRRLSKKLPRIERIHEGGGVVVGNQPDSPQYTAYPADCALAKSIQDKPVSTTSYTVSQLEDGTAYLPLQGVVSKSVPTKPVQPDPDAPVPINAVQPVRPEALEEQSLARVGRRIPDDVDWAANSEPEPVDKARIAELCERGLHALDTVLTSGRCGLVTRAAEGEHTNLSRHALSATSIPTMKQRILRFLNTEGAGHVDMLPKNDSQYSELTYLLRNGVFKNDSLANPSDKQLPSFCNALKWTALALGVGDLNLYDYALNLNCPSITAAIKKQTLSTLRRVQARRQRFPNGLLEAMTNANQAGPSSSGD